MSVFLFYIIESTNVCNYKGDIRLPTCDLDFRNLINKLERGSMLAIDWFENNYVKLNKDKSRFFLSRYKHEMMCSNIEQRKI